MTGTVGNIVQVSAWRSRRILFQEDFESVALYSISKGKPRLFSSRRTVTTRLMMSSAGGDYSRMASRGKFTIIKLLSM